MPHAPLDVHFDEHPKFEGLSLAHFGLMACAIAYCNRVKTDGKVPRRIARGWGLEGEAERCIPELLERKIWKAKDDGYEVAGFLDHNRSAAEINARITANRERQARFKKKKEEGNPGDEAANGNALPARQGQRVTPVLYCSVNDLSSENSDAHAREEAPDPAKHVGCEQRYRDAYEAGIKLGAGGSYGMPLDAQKDLNLAISKHAKRRDDTPLRGEDLLGWIRDAAADFAEDMKRRPKEAQFYSALGPKGFLRWLNEESMKAEARRVG